MEFDINSSRTENLRVLKSVPQSYDEYSRTLISEQKGSIENINPVNGPWKFPESLFNKVDSRGDLLRYYGNTVVFALDDETISKLESLQEKLYGKVESQLSKKLNPKLFHMTLHDLRSSKDSYPAEIKLNNDKARIQKIFKKIVNQVEKNPGDQYITLRPSMIYSSVNISLVMGMIPVSEKDYNVLMNTYKLFDEIVTLNYWLRPHVTLAYFKPVNFNKNEAEEIHSMLKNISLSDFTVRISLKQLCYQTFSSMNDYVNELKMEDLV